MGAFLDIEGAFDRTSIEATTSALLRHGVLPLFAEQQMYYTLWGDNAGRECQGLSARWHFIALLWNLTVEKLLWDLNEAGYYSIRFADKSEANSQAQSLKYYKMR